MQAISHISADAGCWYLPFNERICIVLTVACVKSDTVLIKKEPAEQVLFIIDLKLKASDKLYTTKQFEV